MSSNGSLAKICCVAALCCTLFSCGKANDSAPAVGSISKHPESWLTGHRSAYQQNSDQCRECHGMDLKGGITKVDCFNQGSLARCHDSGHGPRSIIHPIPFIDPALHGVMAKIDLIICQDCHGEAKTAGGNPRFNLKIGSLLTGCEASGCHNQNMAHPKPWKTHGSAGNTANACALCHGANFEGGSGPACRSCHTSLSGIQLPIAGACASCHGNPPDGFAKPNRAGSHAAHLALPEMHGGCTFCHNGGGYGTSGHQAFATHTSAKLAFPEFVNAQGGNSSYDKVTKTCANIKCHGGQTTPLWGTSINVATACGSCHAGSGQPNSYVSGKHNEHVNQQHLACTDCHDVAALAPGHFSNLSSSVLNQHAANTLRSYLNYTKPTCSPTTVPAGNQLGVCHGSRNWQ